MEVNIPELLNSIKSKTVSNYLEDSHRNFAVYTLQNRAIPLFNGLKPVHQRCLWQLRNVSKYEKVAKLAGQVLAIHPHGNVSVEDAINQMTGHHCNNVPFFDGHGAFGTKINPTAFGSARYTSAKTSKFASDVIYKDIEIIEKKPTYDEEDEEPVMFLPLVPLVLLNGIQGIATGYATMILPRDLGDIIDEQIKVLNGKAPINPIPYSKPLANRAIRDKDNPNKYTFMGSVEIIDTATAKITELPYGMAHAQILAKLAAMVESGAIVDYKARSKDTVNIIVTFKKAALKGKSEEAIVKKLGLTTNMSESILVLDPIHGKKVVKYTNPEELITDFTNWRLTFYPKRFKRLIDLNLEEITKLNDIVIAIDNDLGGQAKEFQNRQDLITFIKSIDIVNVDYIANLPVYRFTQEEYNKCKNRIADLEAENLEFQSIIDDEAKQKKIYIDELKDIKKRFG